MLNLKDFDCSLGAADELRSLPFDWFGEIKDTSKQVTRPNDSQRML
jgi:hypothetical protein